MIDPSSMEPVEWTDRMALLLNTLPLRIDRPQDWRVWARHVIQSPEISARNPPNPDQFAEWRDWAYRFNETVFT